MAAGHRKDYDQHRRARELRELRDVHDTRTHHAPLAVRVALRSLLVAPLVLFAISVPARYRELGEISARARTQLGPDDRLLGSFLDAYYPPLVLGLEVFFVLALTLSS